MPGKRDVVPWWVYSMWAVVGYILMFVQLPWQVALRRSTIILLVCVPLGVTLAYVKEWWEHRGEDEK